MPDPIESGVIYSANDRIGIGGRFLIILIDSVMVLSAGLFCIYLLKYVNPEYALLAFVIFSLVYLVVLKATQIRTIGYRICDAKLVDLQGATPDVLRVILRLLLTQIGICNPILDLFWFRLGRKRTLRDLMTGTYVVKSSAQPSGRGDIQFRQLFLFGYAIMYREVKEPNELF